MKSLLLVIGLPLVGLVGHAEARQVGAAAALTATLPIQTVNINDYSGLAAAVATGNQIFFPRGKWTYSGANLNIPNTLVFAAGAELACLGSNVTLTGIVTAAPIQIFASGCTPSFSGGHTPSAFVEWWGAAGDYPYQGASGAGTNNYAPISAAVNSGIKQILATGVYRVAGTLTTTHGDIDISGLSRNTSGIILDDPTGTDDTLWFDGGEGISVHHLNISRIQTATAGACVHAEDTTFFQLYNSSVSGCWNNVFVDGENTGGNQIYINDDQISYAANDDIYLYGASPASDMADIFIDTDDYIRNGTRAGVEAKGHAGFYLTGSPVYGNGYGIYTNAQDSWKIRGDDIDTNVNGNYFNGASNSHFQNNWLGSDGPTIFNGGSNIVGGGNQYNGTSTLQLNGVTNFSSAGDIFTGMNTPVTIGSNGATGSTIVSLIGETFANGTGPFVTFTGTASSGITIGVQMDHNVPVASGTASHLNIVGADLTNNNQSLTSQVLWGESNSLISTSYAGAGGYANNVTGYGSLALGFYNDVRGNYSSGRGQQVEDSARIGGDCWSSGSWGSSEGSAKAAQTCTYNLWGVTTSTTTQRLTTNGSAAATATNCINIPTNDVYTLNATLTGNDLTTVGNLASSYGTTGVLYRATGTATYKAGALGTANGVGTGASVLPAMSADTTNECLNISVTPPNADTWHWDTTVVITEVEN